MSAEQSLPKPLLVLLIVTIVFGGFMAQRTFMGDDGSMDVGFDPATEFDFGLASDDESEPQWVAPADPRNPFLPFFDPVADPALDPALDTEGGGEIDANADPDASTAFADVDFAADS